jgi:5-methylcytosine-specific restriction endonuclease McrA
MQSVNPLRIRLISLRSDRRLGKLARPTRPRLALNSAQRAAVLASTDGRCHICGGSIGDEKWQTDHVQPHSAGGKHLPPNYLPAHALCNNYRWDYLPEEFQIILKLGVWARTQVELDTATGKLISERFRAYEKRRAARRKGV